MKILRNHKISFENISAKAKREIIVIAVLLCISIIINIPALMQDIEKYNIAKAEDAKDFWITSTPEEQGMDSEKLNQVGGALGNTAALSFIVVRHGVIVYEEYYNIKKNDRYNVFSVTKSFISALIGIAIREKYIGGTEDKLESYLPQYFSDIKDTRWKDITIRHLLTMTPGFCEEMPKWSGSGNWTTATFGLPLNYLPGAKFQYANSASHLLSVVLSDATGKSTLEFAEKYLFTPLAISKKDWLRDPQGYYAGYANLYIKPRDMAKFGCLYLNKGKWNGEQVIPSEWVDESTKVQYDFNKEKDMGFENGYGFKWWINGETGYHMYSALGYGGQSINVIPALDLVVVITSRPDHQLSVDDAARMEILKKYVIAAIKDKK